jgi:hypothetical protein
MLSTRPTNEMTTMARVSPVMMNKAQRPALRNSRFSRQTAQR